MQLPAESLAYREETIEAACVYKEDVRLPSGVFVSEHAALLKFVIETVHSLSCIDRVQNKTLQAGNLLNKLQLLRTA